MAALEKRVGGDDRLAIAVANAPATLADARFPHARRRGGLGAAAASRCAAASPSAWRPARCCSTAARWWRPSCRAPGAFSRSSRVRSARRCRLTNGATGPALVAVVEDERLGGQSWTRLYARPGRFPQTIHSAKRFRGPTGLEEYVGYGIGMALRVTVEDGGARLPLRPLFPGDRRPGAGAGPRRSSRAAWRSRTATKAAAPSLSALP